MTTGVGGAATEAGKIIGDVLRQFADMNMLLRTKGVPTMVISHGTVLNCITEHDVPMAGVDHEFGVGGLFSACADVVALGHIHKHQVWGNQSNGFKQLIAYAGSIGRFHHGESGNKHWLEWQLSGESTEFLAHVTPARRTVDLFYSGPPDMDNLREVAASCEGAWVRVRYEVDEEHRQVVDRAAIKAILATAAGVQIEGKTLIIERVRAQGISTAPSVEDKLVQWCEVTATPPDTVVSRFVNLQATSADQVVAEFMKTLQPPQPSAALAEKITKKPVSKEFLAAVGDLELDF